VDGVIRRKDGQKQVGTRLSLGNFRSESMPILLCFRFCAERPSRTCPLRRGCGHKHSFFVLQQSHDRDR
jgi:hypothetical protein